MPLERIDLTVSRGERRHRERFEKTVLKRVRKFAKRRSRDGSCEDTGHPEQLAAYLELGYTTSCVVCGDTPDFSWMNEGD